MKKRIIIFIIVFILLGICITGGLLFNISNVGKGDKDAINLITRYWNASSIEEKNKCIYGFDRIKQEKKSEITVTTGCFKIYKTPKIEYETDYKYIFNHIYVYNFSVEYITSCSSEVKTLNEKIKLIKKQDKYYIYKVPSFK